MATLKQANKAREQHSKTLESQGVHSIGVDQVKKNSKEFELICFVEKENKAIPKEIEVTEGKKKIKVPVKKKIVGKFKAE